MAKKSATRKIAQHTVGDGTTSVLLKIVVAPVEFCEPQDYPTPEAVALAVERFFNSGRKTRWEAKEVTVVTP